jgi:hypothetical protein
MEITTTNVDVIYEVPEFDDYGEQIVPLSYKLGYHKYRCFTCYCVLLIYMDDRDVVALIISLLLSMTQSRDKYGICYSFFSLNRLDFTCSSCIYFDAGNAIYFCAQDVFGPRFQPLGKHGANHCYQKLRVRNVVQMACADKFQLIHIGGTEEEGGGLYASGRNREGQVLFLLLYLNFLLLFFLISSSAWEIQSTEKLW